MPLSIDWDGLYSSQKNLHCRVLVEERIREYHARKGLGDWGVVLARTCPTGWHGEGGSLPTGGHITVRFYSFDNIFFGTHHVYRTDDAYDLRRTNRLGNRRRRVRSN